MKKFSIYAGYHENIIGIENELDNYFVNWQKYGNYTKEQLNSFYFESESGFVFTQQAYNKLKDFLDLDEEYITIFNESQGD